MIISMRLNENRDKLKFPSTFNLSQQTQTVVSVEEGGLCILDFENAFLGSFIEN